MSQPQHHHQQYPIRARQGPAYGGPQHPSQGYPPQVTGPAQGYPPQQSFPLHSQQHLPPQQEPQRYYSPAPADQPFPQSGAPPVGTQPGGPAPFHFLPGGMQPPTSDVRRKPSPQGLAAGDAYGGSQAFQGQIRPNSIHTLNSGNPQELATGGYESPVDNRHSYPSGQIVPPVQPPSAPNDAFTSHHPQTHQAQFTPLRNGHENLPKQHAQNFEPTPSLYPSQQDMQHAQHGSHPQVPSAPGADVPTSPTMPAGGQPYQAYQPAQAQQQQYSQHPAPANGGEGDPGDFYR